MKKTLVLTLIFVMVLTSVGFAGSPISKLKRGTINTLTGWVEAPTCVVETSGEENILSGLTVGVVKGLGLGFIRTAAGLYDIVTFPFAVPEDYAPVLLPEFVYSSDEVAVVEDKVVVELVS